MFTTTNIPENFFALAAESFDGQGGASLLHDGEDDDGLALMDGAAAAKFGEGLSLVGTVEHEGGLHSGRGGGAHHAVADDVAFFSHRLTGLLVALLAAALLCRCGQSGGEEHEREEEDSFHPLGQLIINN